MAINNSVKKNIPTGWQQVTLGDICKVNQGLQIPISERFIEPGKNRKVYITTQYLNGKSETEYIQDFSDSVVCTKEEILMTRTGNSGIVVTGVEGVFHNNFFKVKPNKNISSKLLVYNLLSPYIQYKLLKLAGASTIPDLNHGDFYSIDLLLPPLPEQNRIVLVIETWDKAIEKLENKIKIKKNVKKGLKQRLLSGKIRLSGFSGKWENTKLGKLITGVSERNKKLQETRVLSVTNKLGFILPEQQFARVVASEDLTNYKVIKKGDFAYNPSRINVGSISRLETYNSGVLSPMYIAFRPKESVSSDYLYQWIFTKEANSKIINLASGSVRESVDFKSFCAVKIKLPVLKEQTAIAKILTSADLEITGLEKKLSLLIAQKTYLLNNLITGIIRTPENMKV